MIYFLRTDASTLRLNLAGMRIRTQKGFQSHHHRVLRLVRISQL